MVTHEEFMKMEAAKPKDTATPPCSHLGYWRQNPQSKRGYKMDAVCKMCGAKKIDVFPATTFEGLIRRWVAGKMTEKVGKKTVTQDVCGNYHATATELYFYGAGRKANVGVGKDVLAIKLPDGRLIGNASKLPRCGSWRRGAESPAQRVMQELEIPLIPFNVFQEAKLDLQTAKVVDQGKTEELYVPQMQWREGSGQFEFMDIWQDKSKKDAIGENRPDKTKDMRDLKYNAYDKTWYWEELNRNCLEYRHFIGAMVIEVSGKYYLFDVDRRELGFYRFNAFLSELPSKVKTIAEAYDMLIPQKVRNARKKGLEVPRQGEWFFIPAELPEAVKASARDHNIGEKEPEPNQYDLPYSQWSHGRIVEKDIKEELKDVLPPYHAGHRQRLAEYHAALERYRKARQRLARESPDKYAIRGELRANNNRPNNVDKMLDIPEGHFVKGQVTHSGREHEPLTLARWHIAVPNTAVNSYTIQGAVD